MPNRLGRLDIETWTRYAVLSPNGDDYTSPHQTEVGRKDVVSRMYDRPGRKRVERFIIGHENLFITCDDSKNDECVFSLDENYVFKNRGKFKEWKNLDACEDFKMKNKRALAIEKLSNEKQSSLSDDKFQDTQNVRITVTKGDVTYELPTHYEYVSIDQRMFYFDIVDGKLVAKELDYCQSLYFNNTNTYASYINVPKERMYAIVNDHDYHIEAEIDWCRLFLDGKDVAPEMDKTLSLEELMKRLEPTIRDNIAHQSISSSQFVDFNDKTVEFYIDNKEVNMEE